MLSAMDILATWEAAEHQHMLDRALTMLAFAHPGESRETLAELTMAERDRQLWELREALFGTHIEAQVICPHCSHTLAFEFQVDDICPKHPPAVETPLAVLEDSEHRLQFRLPSSRDLAAVANVRDAETARRVLARRCLVEPQDLDTHDFDNFLSAQRLTELGHRMTELHPQAETRLHFTCPECRKDWSDVVDVAGFLWAELSAKARQLLLEVDTLARVYGWNESEVLALTPTRRAAYIRLATS
jgi:hypothetical protein